MDLDIQAQKEGGAVYMLNGNHGAHKGPGLGSTCRPQCPSVKPSAARSRAPPPSMPGPASSRRPALTPLLPICRPPPAPQRA
jgi:hypothetical protein